MRRLWWTWILVFLLGLGAGKEMAVLQSPEGENSLQAFPTETRQEETAPPTQTEQTPNPENSQSVFLPHTFRYTSLVARRLAVYDGPSQESGTQEYLEGVTALVLENTGNVGIEFAQVLLVQQGKTLVFEATYIPPQAAVLIVEKNHTPYSGGEIEDGRCRTVIPGSFDWEKELVFLEERDLGSLALTNLTERPIACTRIFYKRHDKEADLYIGGITYSAVVTNLLPGETRVITPYRYTCGYTGIVAVTTE